MQLAMVVATAALLATGSNFVLAQASPSPAGSGSSLTAQTGSEDHPARISGGVIAGHILHRVTPIYPKIAKEDRIAGALVMGAIIDPSGKIVKLTIISGPEALRESTLAAVRQWTYKPFLLNGVPVFLQTTITINMQMGAS